MAQSLPGPADPGRIEPLERPVVPERPPADLVVPEAPPGVVIPDAAKSITFRFNRLNLKGVTAFSEAELADIYEPYLDTEVSLDVVWLIAGAITERYLNDGYFLSRAYVPAQEIDDGVVTIEVVEGFISRVDLDAPLAERFVVRELIERLTAQRPLTAFALESFMLQVNALPGVSFRGFVEPLEGAPAGVTKLSLRPTEEKGQAVLTADNFGSRFLGPHQWSASYADSFLPLQQTFLTASTSLPTYELQYIALRQQIPLYPDWQVELSGSYVHSQPGSSLEPSEIESESVELGIGIFWQPLRQRQENLVFSLELTGKNTDGDILGDNPLTRDRIRALRGGISYDFGDGWNGYNYASLQVSRGLSIRGASDEGDLNLSRAEAEPDFTALQLSYTRLQSLPGNFLAVGRVAGQVASGPLYSAEEFGYGGPTFGRAYDPSELTGDHGIATSVELRYQGLEAWQDLTFTPYAFYDIGRVWNEDSASQPESAASGGAGLRLTHTSGVTAELGVAWPLTREVDNPIYGNGKSPRVLLQIGIQF